MSLAFVVSQRSYDPSTKHGCVVVSNDNTVLSLGYNSPPRGCDDQLIPVTRPSKYCFFEHAESNSINNAARTGISLRDSCFYITGFPCPACFRRIVNVGAFKIVYGLISSHCISDSDVKAIELMNNSRIQIIPHNNTNNVLQLLSQCSEYINKKLTEGKN